MKFLLLTIIFFVCSQSICQKHLFVEIKSKADYQIVTEFFYIKLNDTEQSLNLCSLTELDSLLISTLNKFDNRIYVDFINSSLFPSTTKESIDSSKTQFENAKKKYDYVTFETSSYKIRLSIVDEPTEIEFKEMKTTSQNIVPKFFINEDKLDYKRFPIKKMKLVTKFKTK